MSDESTDDWWRNCVIYQVYVRSFADHDGDGNGDLAGLTSRLDYLATLGVDAVWLTPFQPSPMADGGYDVADYRDVDPRFGTLADFDALIAQAHKLGIRIIVDIVPNHTSSAHPWFQAAVADPSLRARYHFRDGQGEDGSMPPNDWQSVFGGPAWTRLADSQWYLHLFDSRQPDLNWQDDDVITEFDDVLRFWLDRGVDGFRIDVAHGLAKADGLPDAGVSDRSELLGGGELPYFDQDEVHDIYRRWRRILDSYAGRRIAIAEAWASTPTRLARYVSADELHLAFNFHLLDFPWHAASLRPLIDDALAAMSLVRAPATWVLSNHDVVRHSTRLGDLSRARAATLFVLALPGTVCLYQGEELGLPEVLELPDACREDPVFARSGGKERGRDGCRVPLPWALREPAYGFNTTGEAWLPQPDEFAELAIDVQDRDPHSTLTLYREMLRLRTQFDGPLEWEISPPDVLAFRRTGMRCLLNLSDRPISLPEPATLTSSPCETGQLPSGSAAWILDHGRARTHSR